eukprot:CAMPEP_0172518400 /NCGR_PEP_ID=MMETSP1066-20121228/290800_1 /TAXON_ID=671091 /ORGANISM="Coscinodiscus wailesii, Strain CCMP2513" /LENGTH=692 /DNA_ID=CAMNT_0013300785 /DNA_START=47 /DNA_END=2125 /DNA_ORIENTATION=+
MKLSLAETILAISSALLLSVSTIAESSVLGHHGKESYFTATSTLSDVAPSAGVHGKVKTSLYIRQDGSDVEFPARMLAPIATIEQCHSGTELLDGQCIISENYDEIMSSKGWRLWTTSDHTEVGYAWDIDEIELYEDSQCHSGTELLDGQCIISENYDEIMSSKGWRLWTTSDHTEVGYAWDIDEIELYEDSQCAGASVSDLPGTVSDSGNVDTDAGNVEGIWAPQNAFAAEGVWGGRRDSNNFFWVAKMFDTDVSVKCLKIKSPNWNDRGATEVRVQAFVAEENEWKNAWIEKNLNVGALSVNTIKLIYDSNPPTPTPTDTGEWYINNIDSVTEEITTKHTVMLYVPFNTSDRAIETKVFKSDCITRFDESENLFDADKTEKISSKPDGFVQFNSTLEVNITALNKTNYWNAFIDGTRGGWVQVCLETALVYEKPDDIPDLGNGNTNEKITFKSNIFNVSVTLTSDFTVNNVNVKREQATKENISTDYSKFIDAYQCNEDSLNTEVTKTYNQGDEIMICVKDTSNGIVQVEEFFDLQVVQDNLTPYNYIKKSLWNPAITAPGCVDNGNGNRRVCYAKVLALARFFAKSDNPPDLTFTGSVFVVRDGRRVRRNLHMALQAPEEEEKNKGGDDIVVSGNRRAQDDGGEGSGDFEVSVSLGLTDNSAASNLISGTVAIKLLLIILSAAKVVLLD